MRVRALHTARRTFRPAAGALALVVVLIAGRTLAAQSTPLFVVPTEGVLAAPLTPQDPLRVALYTRDVAGLAKTLGLAPPAANVDRLEYVIDAYPQLAAGTGQSWLDSTFVIDYDEPVVTPLREEMRRATSPRPSIAQVVSFVASTVKGTYGRSFDFASTVARRREGDCTEYAVLTAALLRSVGVPARVVLGVALVPDGSRFGSFGHAWTEVRQDGRWIVADAALHGATGVRYVPYGVMTDEGPGYTLGLARMTSAWVQRVVVLGGGASAR